MKTDEQQNQASPAPDRRARDSNAFLKKARRVGKFINALALVAPRQAGRLAFRIFCSPRRQPLRDQDRSFLSTAHQSILQAEGLQIRVYTWHSSQKSEKKRVVLFLHGWESNSGRWRKYVKPICNAGFTVMALDAPAHGNSSGKQVNLPLYSRVIKAFMEHYGTPEALVGHSLGGAALVMSMGAFEAPRVRKAVVLSGFAETSRVMHDFSRILGLKPVVSEYINREIEKRSGMRIEQYSVVDKAALLHEVKGLVLHDQDDDVAPVEEGQLIADAWNAQFIQTQGLGHRMQDKSVINHVLAFLQS
ncbi:MAG: alpha/beta hydrolase [Bacteroidota bacterium]